MGSIALSILLGSAFLGHFSVKDGVGTGKGLAPIPSPPGAFAKSHRDGTRPAVPTSGGATSGKGSFVKAATAGQADEHRGGASFSRTSLSNNRGLYVRGQTAASDSYPLILSSMADRGIDTVVLDAKDYDGLLTYPSKSPLARDAGAVRNPPLPSLALPISKAHAAKLRVAVRVSCFNDEWMAKAKPRLSVQSKAGRPYPIGWLDPSNVEAQDYILSLVREAIDAGADEIQLDYVRYPVLGIKNADFHLEARNLKKTEVIRDFVRRVHQVTQAHRIPLALDVFGVIAFGKRSDIDELGQDPAYLAAECEVLSPMVYPSHYAPGFAGFESPGEHPELVGMATKAFLDEVEKVPVSRRAVVRPWLQAMRWKTPNYSPSYLASEMRSAKESGGSGWLLWNPGQNYSYAWTAVKNNSAPTRLADLKAAKWVRK